MDKNYFLSTPLNLIPKIFSIPNICNACKIKPANCLPEGLCFIFNNKRKKQNINF